MSPCQASAEPPTVFAIAGVPPGLVLVAVGLLRREPGSLGRSFSRLDGCHGLAGLLKAGLARQLRPQNAQQVLQQIMMMPPTTTIDVPEALDDNRMQRAWAYPVDISKVKVPI